jgi:hypothetical protein
MPATGTCIGTEMACLTGSRKATPLSKENKNRTLSPAGATGSRLFFFQSTKPSRKEGGPASRAAMIRKTFREAIGLLLLALFLALLYHAVSSSGLTLFKKKYPGSSTSSFFQGPSGAGHGS